MKLEGAIPAMPVRDAGAAAAFYRDRIGFTVVHQEDGFAILRRDGAEVHLWQADDESWRDRDTIEKPVRSGAESFIAGTASFRVMCAGVDELWEELSRAGVLHPVSHDGVSATDYGTREAAATDDDGNLITFFEPRG